MLALDAVEQVDARPFQPVGADAGQHARALGRQVQVEERVAEPAHPQPGRGDVAPDDGPVAQADHGRDQFVLLPPQALQLGAGGRQVRGLVEQRAGAHQHLVGADHDGAGRVEAGGLHPGQRDGQVLGAAGMGRLHRGLIDMRGTHLHAQAGVPQQRRAGHGLAREHQVLPLDHGVGARAALRLRSCQASISCSTVAAVSSMLRRVTSITGQPRRAHRRRAHSSSAFTASTST